MGIFGSITGIMFLAYVLPIVIYGIGGYANSNPANWRNTSTTLSEKLGHGTTVLAKFILVPTLFAIAMSGRLYRKARSILKRCSG